ncbi:unnamed protein product, partial [Cylicostephanus goldi]
MYGLTVNIQLIVREECYFHIRHFLNHIALLDFEK